MKSELLWCERLPTKDNFANIIFDCCFKPDGSQLLLAMGSRVLVYDTESGDLLHSLKGHRDYVYAVSYARDGKRFASGGADKTIIIWTSKCEGILKYAHNDPIQALAYNPVNASLASCTASDFGLWSPEQKSVAKFKVSAKAVCCAWNADGQYLVLGQMNGHVSIRDRLGVEKWRIERTQPIWSIAFAPQNKFSSSSSSSASSSAAEVMAVACWDQTLSFYDLQGQQVSKDRSLGYDPCCISYYQEGEYLLICGSNRKVSLYTKDGVFLKMVCEVDDWVWSVKARPVPTVSSSSSSSAASAVAATSASAMAKSRQFSVSCQDGLLAMYTINFSTVHGLYQDRYAHRETMTDVIIQHLLTEQKVRIKTRDYVKKIAVYKARLAIQLPDRILIYETDPQEPLDMHYKLKEKIVVSTTASASSSSSSSPSSALDCNLLVVTSHHIILCQERTLQLLSFAGQKLCEWRVEAVIRYIRVIGGPERNEGLLVGLKNGGVYKIFLENRFPVKLVQHAHAIRCLDLSSTRQQLAVVDEQSRVYVYDLSATGAAAAAAPSSGPASSPRGSSSSTSTAPSTSLVASSTISSRITFESGNANSVAWNTEFEDMLCFSGNSTLSIKTSNFPLHSQPMQGFVVGFKSSKIFCLHFLSMQTIDVPQSASMFRYLERAIAPSSTLALPSASTSSSSPSSQATALECAYKVACLGVTEHDWRELALTALQLLDFRIARAAFIRIRDVKFIELLNKIEISRRALRQKMQARAAQLDAKEKGAAVGEEKEAVDVSSAASASASASSAPLPSDSMFLGEILAFQGQFQEAAKVFIKHGRRRRAIEMFLDLRDWVNAKQLIEEYGLLSGGAEAEDDASSASSSSSTSSSSSSFGVDEDGTPFTLSELLRREANWLLETGDLLGAAEMFWASKERLTACNILGTHRFYPQLHAKITELSPRIDSEKQLLLQAALHFKRGARTQELKDTLLKLEDWKAVLSLMLQAAQSAASATASAASAASPAISSSASSAAALLKKKQQELAPSSSNSSSPTPSQPEVDALWAEARAFITLHPELSCDFYLMYAEYLASLDRFLEAQEAYDLAGRPRQCIKMLETLILNVLSERRFSEAAYFHLLLSKECAKAAEQAKNGVATSSAAASSAASAVSSSSSPSSSTSASSTRASPLDHPAHWIAQFWRHRRLSEIYHAYHMIERYTVEPFTSMLPDALFQTAHFVLNSVAAYTAMASPSASSPSSSSSFASLSASSSSSLLVPGVSLVYTLFALAKQAKMLGGHKIGRLAYAALLHLKLPPPWRDQVEMNAMSMRTLPFSDATELMPVCYRCSTSNPLMIASSSPAPSSSAASSSPALSTAPSAAHNTIGDVCCNCHHPFIRSCCAYEILPLVQFVLSDDISEEEALKLIEQDPEMIESTSDSSSSSSTKFSANSESMSLENEDSSNTSSSSSTFQFADRLLHYEPNADGHYTDIVLQREELRSMPHSRVFRRKYAPNIAAQYFYLTMTEIPVALCAVCQSFFHAEDKEFHVLQHHTCPVCRAPEL